MLVPGTEPLERHDVADDVYNTTLGDLKAHDCVNSGILQAGNTHNIYICVCEPPQLPLQVYRLHTEDQLVWSCFLDNCWIYRFTRATTTRGLRCREL